MSKKVILYRMVIEEYICFYGLRLKDLLEWEGYLVEDNYFILCSEIDNFK